MANTPDGTTESTVTNPTSAFNEAEQIVLALHSNKENRESLATTGLAPSKDINFGNIKNVLGSDIQLQSGEKYLVNAYNEKVKQDAYNEAKQKADDQGFFGEAWGFLAQTVAGEVVMGTIEGTGYLLDLTHWADKLGGGEGDWNNWLSDWASKQKQNIAEAAPIYQDPENKNRTLMQNLFQGDGFIASNMVSVGSTLSMLIPVAGFEKGLSVLGEAAAGTRLARGVKSINLVKNIMEAIPDASEGLKMTTTGVKQAALSRHIESQMEAVQVYNEKYKQYLDQGMSEEDAKKAADAGASFVYKANWAMMLTDIPQYIMIGKGFKASKAVLTKKLAEAAGTSVTKALALKYGDHALQFASEGFEEAYQFAVSEEGKYHADIVAGIRNPNETTLKDRIKGYMQDGDMATAAFFGGFGGLAFGAVAPKVTSIVQNKLLKNTSDHITEEQVRIKEIQERKQIISANVKAYYEAVAADDERAMEASKSRIGFDIGVNAARVGNWAIAKGAMEQLKNATAEERKEYGIDSEFNTNIDEWIQSAEKAVELYSRNVGKYDASTVEPITYRQHTLWTYNKKKPELQQRIDNLKQEIPMINEVSPEAKAIFEARLDLLSNQRYIRTSKWRLENQNIPLEDKKALEESITQAETQNTELKSNVDGIAKEHLTAKDNSVLASLNGKMVEDLSKAKSELKHMENYMQQYANEINELTSDDFQKSIKEKQEALAKEAQQKAAVSKKAEQVQKSKDRLNGVMTPEQEAMMSEEMGSETNMSVEDVDGALNRGEMKMQDLPAEMQDMVNAYRANKNKKVEDEDEESGIEDNPNTFTLPTRDANEDHQKTTNSSLEHVDVEIAENPANDIEFRKGDDNTYNTITPEISALAWKSTNNSQARKSDKTEENKALASFLEGPESLKGVSIVFDINKEYLEARANERGVKQEIKQPYVDILKALQEGRVPNNIGNIPVTGKLHRDGVPIVHMEKELFMSLHETNFFYDNAGNPKGNNVEAQAAAVEKAKREIVEAYLKGQKLEAGITGKTNGNINVAFDENGNFAKNKISDVIGNVKDVEFIYGNVNKMFVSKEKEHPEFFHIQATPGAVYAITKTANGSPFPLRLQANNLSNFEASIIFQLYVDILKDSTNFDKNISDNIINALKNSPDTRLKGISTYMNLNDTKYRELLGHLVFDGKKTESKDMSRLLTFPANEERKTPAVLAFGDTTMDLDNLISPSGRSKFIDYLVNNRRRQVDVKMLDDVKYKTYLNDTKILTTNATPTPTKAIFVQPTITYNSNLKPTNIVETKDVVEKEWDNYLDTGKVSNEVIKAIAENIKRGTPSAKMTQLMGESTIAQKVESILAKDTQPIKEEKIEEEDDKLIESENENTFVFSPPNTENVSKKEDEAEKAKEEARKERLERAKKKREEGKQGPFKSFKAIGSEKYISLKDEAKHIQSLLPREIGVELTPGYVHVLKQGYVATGLFKNGMITLSENGPKGTGYHEAFHAVYRTLLSQKERNNILTEAVANYPKPSSYDINKLISDLNIDAIEAHNIYYEELLADEFGNVMSDPSYSNNVYKYSRGIAGLFQRLSDWIKHVFSKGDTTRRLFDDVAKSKYKTKIPNITRSIAFKRHPFFTADEVRELTLQLTYAAFSKVDSLETLDQLDMNLMQDALDNAELQAAEQDNNETLERISQLYDSNGKLDKFWIDSVNSYIKDTLGLKKVNKIDDKDDIDTDPDIDLGDGDSETRNFLKSSYEVSGKESATKTVKFLVALVPQFEYNSEGKRIYRLSTLTGMPAFNDFGTTWNTLETTLSGIVPTYENGVLKDSFDSMVDALVTESKYKPELGFIVEKLKSMSEAVQTQFHFTFSRQKGNYVDHFIEGSSGTLRSRIGNSNIESKERVIRETWAGNFANNFGTYDEDDNFVYNPAAISKFKRLRDDFSQTLMTDLLNKEFTFEKVKLPNGEIISQPSVLNKLKIVLNALGVQLQPAAIAKILDEKNMPMDPQHPDRHLINAVKSLENDLLNATNAILTKTGVLNESTNLILDEGKFFKDILANAEADFRKIGGESSFVGPDGKQIWIYQDNNLISKAISQFKSGDLTHLQELKDAVGNNNSVWLKELLDPKTGEKSRDTFEIALYGNYKQLGAKDRGAKASELKPADQLNDVINKYLQGYYIGLAEADKSQQTYIKGPRLYSSGVSYDSTRGVPYFKNTSPISTKIIMGYLADELSRMEAARKAYYGYKTEDGTEYPPLAESKQLLYYHYNLDKKGDRIPGNAFESFLFPGIDLVSLGLKDPDTGEIYPLDYGTFDGNSKVKKYVETQFLNAVQKDLAKAVENSIIKRDGNVYSNRTIDIDQIEKRGGVVEAIADYTLNSLIANVEQTKMFNGDPALYKVKLKFDKEGNRKPWIKHDIFGDFKKRIPAAIASGKDFRIFNELDGTVAVRPKYSSAVVANIDNIPSKYFSNPENIKRISEVTGVSYTVVSKLFEPYLHVNMTDAQAWITFKTYRERLRGLGKWIDSHQAAYDIIIENEERFKRGDKEIHLSSSQIKLLAQPLKTVHTELMRTEGNIMSMQYNKQSEAVLLPFLTRGTDLDNIRQAMEDQEVDHVIVLDGKKTGAMGITKINDSDKPLSAKDIKFNKTWLSYSNLFLQQDLSAHGIGQTIVGSQAVKNVLSVVDTDEKYLNDLTGRELIDEYHKTISKLSDLGLISYKKEIGYSDENGFSKDEKGLPIYNSLLKREFSGEMSDNHLDALDSDIELDALPIKDKAQNKFLAMLTKKSVKLKQLGGALIQTSSFGFIGTTVSLNDNVKNGIVWFKNPKEELQAARILDPTVNKIGYKAAQVLLPHGKLVEMLNSNKGLREHIKKEFGANSYKDLTHEQVKSLIAKDVLRGLSYRIPNQGPASNDAFEIVGILPIEMGDNIVSFSEITTKTGSDFDIDKAFIMLPNFYYNNDSKKIEKIKYDATKPTSLGLQNYRLDIMRSMLMHPKSYTSVMAPLDDPWLSDLAEELFPVEGDQTDLDFFTGSTQLDNKSTFDNAKNLVGTIANHMTHHSLALSEGLYFKGYYLGKGIQDENGDSLISNRLDEDGKKVENTLGAFMNAIVDAAKDPYITRANINQFTASTAFMMTRAGISREWVVSFIGQPILKDLVAETARAEGKFAEPTFKDGKVIKPIDIIIERYGISHTAKELYSPELAEVHNLTLETLKNQIIESRDKDRYMNVKGNGSQIAVLAAFLQWQSKAKALNDVIKLSKADVEGSGRNLIRAKLSVNLLNKVINDNAIGNVDKLIGYHINPVTREPIIDGNRMTGSYFQNSVLAAREIFKNMFVTNTAASERSLDSIATDAGYLYLLPGEEHERLADSINNELYALTVAQTSAFDMSSDELHALLYGSKDMYSIASRVQQAKRTELINNLLISSLETKKGYGGAPSKVLLPSNETTKQVKDDLYLAWEELFKVDKSLAEDLVKYSFYASGFSRSVGNFFEHIPMKYLQDMHFSEEIRGFKEEYASNESALFEKEDLVFKNSYKDNKLVPVVPEGALSGMRTTDGKLQVSTDDGFIITEEKGQGYINGLDENSLPVFRRFVKREVKQYNQEGEVIGVKYQLFQLQGYSKEGAAVYIRTNTLGYNDRGNTIKEYNTKGNVSIFEENNVPLGLRETLLPYLNATSPRGTAIQKYDPNLVEQRTITEDMEDLVNFCLNQ